MAHATASLPSYECVEDKKGYRSLIKTHMALVRKIAWHVHGHVSSAIEPEDLIQIGNMALIEAADRYEPRPDASFASYAAIRIRGAMIDQLRKQASKGRSAMAKKKKLNQGRNHFRQTYGYDPNDQELAQSMSLSMEDYYADKKNGADVQYESLDEVYSDHSLWYADSAPNSDELFEFKQFRSILKLALDNLGEKEAKVLQLYYVEELNLEEIGAVLGVGAARICQIKKTALDKIRIMLQEYKDPED